MVMGVLDRFPERRRRGRSVDIMKNIIIIILFFCLFLVSSAYAQQKIVVVEKILEDEISVKELSPQKFEISHGLRNVQSKRIERLVIKDYLPLKVDISGEPTQEEGYKGEKWETVTFSIPMLEPKQSKKVSYVLTFSEERRNFSAYLGHKIFSIGGYKQEINPQFRRIEVETKVKVPESVEEEPEGNHVDAERTPPPYQQRGIYLPIFIFLVVTFIIFLSAYLLKERKKEKEKQISKK